MALVFLFFVERFDVYHQDEEKSRSEKVGLPAEDPISHVRLEAPWASPSYIYSLVFVVAAAVTTGLLPRSVFQGVHPEPHRVQHAMLRAMKNH